MKSRPILFSAPMVRALLAGAKTQTRRIVKPQPNDPDHLRIIGPDGFVHYTRLANDPLIDEAKGCQGYRVLSCAEWLATQGCPYGRPGDRLWVRETWCRLFDMDNKEDERTYYRATDDVPEIVDGDGYTEWRKDGKPVSPWKPSIHMPRAFSRIILEIASIRVERLQCIDGGDVLEEGVGPDALRNHMRNVRSGLIGDNDCDVDWDWEADWIALWESINGPGSWDANPLVWVIEFNRVTP